MELSTGCQSVKLNLTVRTATMMAELRGGWVGGVDDG